MMDAQYNFEGKLLSLAVSLLWALLYEIVNHNTQKRQKKNMIVCSLGCWIR